MSKSTEKLRVMVFLEYSLFPYYNVRYKIQFQLFGKIKIKKNKTTNFQNQNKMKINKINKYEKTIIDDSLKIDNLTTENKFLKSELNKLTTRYTTTSTRLDKIKSDFTKSQDKLKNAKRLLQLEISKLRVANTIIKITSNGDGSNNGLQDTLVCISNFAQEQTDKLNREIEHNKILRKSVSIYNATKQSLEKEKAKTTQLTAEKQRLTDIIINKNNNITIENNKKRKLIDIEQEFPDNISSFTIPEQTQEDKDWLEKLINEPIKEFSLEEEDGYFAEDYNFSNEFIFEQQDQFLTSI